MFRPSFNATATIFEAAEYDNTAGAMFFSMKREVSSETRLVFLLIAVSSFSGRLTVFTTPARAASSDNVRS